MADQNTNDKNRSSSTAGGEEAIRSKKNFGLNDMSNAFTRGKVEHGAVANPRGGGGRIIIWIFSVLLFITGISVMILTAFTVIGSIFGLIMVIVAIILPFYVRGDWMKRNVE